MAVKRDLLVDKLLNQKQYNTVYISKADEDKAHQDQVETMTELLCDDRHKAGKQAVFNFIKKEPKAVEVLIAAISQATADKKDWWRLAGKVILIALHIFLCLPI